MTAAAVHEASLLQRRVCALERENEHLKDRLVAAANEIAKRDRIIADQAERAWRQLHSHRW